MTIRARLEALEQRSPANAITVIIRTFVSPGHLDAEPQRMTCKDLEWLRRDGETAEDFRARAVNEARKVHSGFLTMISFPTRGPA